MTMRRAIRIVAAVLLPACLSGCGLAMRPVALDATPAVWERLAGEWRGEYTVTGHDRRGLIAFKLNALDHQAAGEVLMIPDRFAWPYGARPDVDRTPGRQPGRDSQLLVIRFVDADAGRVRGSMDPYWDPDRECLALASFLGSLDGESIGGTFTSVCEDGVRAWRGSWRVDRRRLSAR